MFASNLVRRKQGPDPQWQRSSLPPSLQGISTGKHHAAVMTNSEQWETACVRAGRSSGDLAHPLVYCPELHFSEFTSAVADMKNSVAVSEAAGMEVAASCNEPTPVVWLILTCLLFPPATGSRERSELLRWPLYWFPFGLRLAGRLGSCGYCLPSPRREFSLVLWTVNTRVVVCAAG